MKQTKLNKLYRAVRANHSIIESKNQRFSNNRFPQFSDEELLPVLAEVIEKHIVEYGVNQFIVGRYGGFDALAARALLAAKARHPELSLLQLIPYHPAERTVPLHPGFGGTIYPFEDCTPPRRLAIVKANEEMICTCDYLIAYAWHPASNARKLVEKAQKLEQAGGIRVTNIAETREQSNLPISH